MMLVNRQLIQLMSRQLSQLLSRQPSLPQHQRQHLLRHQLHLPTRLAAGRRIAGRKLDPRQSRAVLLAAVRVLGNVEPRLKQEMGRAAQ
jgi:hypothetical protein